MTLFLTAEKDFPYKCFEETGVIEGVKAFKEVKRNYSFFCMSEPWIPLPTLRRFCKLAEQGSSFVYVLDFFNTVTVYDGEFPLCKILTDLQFNDLSYSVEPADPLISKCLSALFHVLPSDLFNTLHSDITQKLWENKIMDKDRSDNEAGRDRSSEFGIFSSLVISLLKDGKNKEEKRAKFAYKDGTRENSNPYEALLNSQFHLESQVYVNKYFPKQFPSGPFSSSEGISLNSSTSSSSFIRHIFTVIDSLHLLYEDLKLDIFQYNHLYALGNLMFSLARLLGKYGEKYAEYYLKAHPSFAILHSNTQINLEEYLESYVNIPDKNIPSIYAWLTSMFKGQTPEFMPILFERTRVVCKVFECFTEKDEKSSGLSPLCKKSPGMYLDTDLAVSVKYPVFMPVEKEKRNLVISSGSKINKIIQVLVEEKIDIGDLKTFPAAFALPILEVIKKIQSNPPVESINWPKKALKLLNRLDIYNNSSSNKKNQTNDKKTHFDQQYEQILQLELQRADDHSGNLSEYIFPKDLRMEEVAHILDVTKALKMRMPENVISDEHFETEKHNLLYKICLKRASTCIGYGALTLGTSKASPTSASSVPQINFSAFLPPNFETKMQMSPTELETREKDFMVWPKFHIGVATGLKMLSEDPKDYVRNRQWITYHRGEEESNEHAGFIMALGLLGQLEALHDLDIYRYLRAEQESIIIAIYLGTAASSLGSMDERIMRVLRISIAFLIPPFVDIEIKLTQEAASIMGFGLLYKCSGNRQVTEMLIVQLGRKALTNKDIEREGLSLSAGLALGMVNLASGAITPGLEDLRIDERLIRLFEGGKRMQPPKILQTGYLMGESVKCSVTQEGENFVTSITAPGALIAYALIHLKSNNELAADKIEIPNTFYGLEWARPEHLMIKILCRNLILMDSVHGSKNWLYGQIPSLIQFCFANTLGVVNSKYADKDIDYSTIANCYVYCITGGFLSLAFKYLGSADSIVANLLIDEILVIREMKTQVLGSQHEVTDQNKNSIDKQTLLTALCVGCLSLGMIMAGTGDVQCFRIMKRIRKRVEGEYGFSIAVHMAIGFLFLGNCQYSFSNSDFSIAAILAAIYPKFPNSPSDNRFHLQAFRHLYILALEKRLLITKDANLKTLIHVPVKINYSDIGQVVGITPVLLRPLNLCTSIEVIDKEFFSYRCELGDLKKLVLFVKKKVENTESVESWKWVEDLNKMQNLEGWVGDCDNAEEFWKSQEIAGKVLEKFKNWDKVDRTWKVIRDGYNSDRQEIVPYLLRLKEKTEDLECVKIFYTKVLARQETDSLLSMQELYELYR